MSVHGMPLHFDEKVYFTALRSLKNVILMLSAEVSTTQCIVNLSVCKNMNF